MREHRAAARLGVDRRIDSGWVDLEDVTRVRTVDERIVDIGKGIAAYDCFDTGVFAIGRGLFEALRGLEFPSLTEGMRALAAEGAALTVDCGELGWIDVDDESGARTGPMLGSRKVAGAEPACGDDPGT